jgi:hypothetical protein
MPDILNALYVQYNLLSTFAVDAGVALYNAATPSLPKGGVIPEGRPGHGGVWPAYEPPKAGDSRSPCPALNAMANHGIFPRDGKNIRFTDMSRQIHETYNFANTVCAPHSPDAAQLADICFRSHSSFRSTLRTCSGATTTATHSTSQTSLCTTGSSTTGHCAVQTRRCARIRPRSTAPRLSASLRAHPGRMGSSRTQISRVS